MRKQNNNKKGGGGGGVKTPVTFIIWTFSLRTLIMSNYHHTDGCSMWTTLHLLVQKTQWVKDWISLKVLWRPIDHLFKSFPLPPLPPSPHLFLNYFSLHTYVHIYKLQYVLVYVIVICWSYLFSFLWFQLLLVIVVFHLGCLCVDVVYINFVQHTELCFHVRT